MNSSSVAASAAIATPARQTWMTPALARLAVIALLLIAWEIIAQFFADPLFLSPPSAVVARIVPVLREPGVANAIFVAAYELAIAFVMAVIVGLALGLVVGMQRFAYLTFLPVIIFLFAIPQSTLLPIFISVFGIGVGSKIAFGFSHGVFPILVTVVAAVQKIKPILGTAAMSMGASRMDVVRHVIVPSIVPSFFTGIRLGMASTLIGVLLAELYISQQGIGYFTRRFSHKFEPASLFALVAILSALAVIVNELMRIFEARFSRWKDN